jgi:hypothetical protein
VRARLDCRHIGDEFRFICAPAMAKQMGPIIAEHHGMVVERDERSYGVVFLVRKVP